MIRPRLGPLKNMRAYQPLFHFLYAATAGMLAACVSTVDRAPVTYQMIDRPGENRIELRYQNNTEHAVCLTSSSWPDGSGNLNQMGNRIALLVDGQRFQVRQFNKGPCIVVEYTCVASVPPGKGITTSIPYEAFGLPASVRYKRKTLDFSPSPPACH